MVGSTRSHALITLPAPTSNVKGYPISRPEATTMGCQYSRTHIPQRTLTVVKLLLITFNNARVMYVHSLTHRGAARSKEPRTSEARTDVHQGQHSANERSAIAFLDHILDNTTIARDVHQISTRNVKWLWHGKMGKAA